MIDDFMGILIDSGLTTNSGQDFNKLGKDVMRALWLVCSADDPKPRDLAEILAQYLELPEPGPAELIEAPTPVATLRVNLNLDLAEMSDYKLDRLAGMIKGLNKRITEDSDNG